MTVEKLDEVIENLKKIADDLGETEDNLTGALNKNKEYRDRLEEAADILAESGHITNTPYAKRKWIEGGVK